MFWTKQRDERDVGRRRLLRELREACPEGTRSYAIVDGLRVQDAKVWLDDDEARARFDAEHLAVRKADLSHLDSKEYRLIARLLLHRSPLQRVALAVADAIDAEKLRDGEPL